MVCLKAIRLYFFALLLLVRPCLAGVLEVRYGLVKAMDLFRRKIFKGGKDFEDFKNLQNLHFSIHEIGGSRRV